MLFSIITPTYKRSEKLTRAVESLRKQTYKNWEMVIVNDSPQDTSYASFPISINDPRIHYHVNDINKGVNYTRNKALNLVSADSRWIIFLDDDDYLAPDTLQTFHDLILLHDDIQWFVTNRAYSNGISVTNFPSPEHFYSYNRDYLILRRCKGDATHCIEKKHIDQQKIHFLRHVKQADEWFFFYQLGLHKKMFYHDHNSTITDGYDPSSGLNFRKRSRTQQLETLLVIIYEGRQAKLLTHITFWIYLSMRVLRILIKS
jgi:glycosyltransferase involved in cell wall biosynthesis